MMSCFGFRKKQANQPPLFPFTTFVLRVDETGAWESSVVKVLKKTKEVSNFRMYDGNLKISGTINPVLLLKVLAKNGKAARLVNWQFGECSRNLQMPEYEQYQQYKQQYRQYHQYLADMQAIYNDAYDRRGGGHGRGHNHGHNYVDGYGRRYGNAQYLPCAHQLPQTTHYLPAHGYPRYYS